MASYRQFEDLPVWQDAIRLAAEVFELTARPSFKFRGDLVNQIRRSSLSVSNNIAEGFERGTTTDLVNFLYIARGSCGETRSMLRFALQRDGFEMDVGEIDKVADHCVKVSRQLFGWIEALKDSDIKDQKSFDRQARRVYAESKTRERFSGQFSREEEERALRENRFGEYCAEKLRAEIAVRQAGENAAVRREAQI